MKIKELRNLPFRKWDEVKTYKSIVVVPSGKKHDSGWALMYIIGLDSEKKPIEIAAACDDICWKIPTATDYNFRNDMFYPSGAIHFWSNGHSFKVGASLSSTDVFLVKNKLAITVGCMKSAEERSCFIHFVSWCDGFVRLALFVFVLF